MEFVDKAFARRLEAAEEMPQVHIAHALQKQRPELGAEEEEICGGHMVFTEPNSPVGRTVGMGFDGPVSPSDLDRMEEFYRSRGVPAQIDVCPYTSLELVAQLKERGYRLAEFNQVLYRRISTGDPFPVAANGVEFRPARSDEAELWGDVVGRGFRDGQPCPPEFRQMIVPSFQVPHAIPFLAFVDGQLAAGAGGLIIPERRLLALAGAATLPEFRGRGIQTAFLQLRMKLAAEAGCDVAVTVTQGGTTSQHNAERVGFKVAYSKATLIL